MERRTMTVDPEFIRTHDAPAVTLPDGWTATADRNRTGFPRVAISNARRTVGHIVMWRQDGRDAWAAYRHVFHDAGTPLPMYLASFDTAQKAADRVVTGGVGK